MTARPGERFFYLRDDETVVLKVMPRPEWAIASFAVAFLIATPIQALLRVIPKWLAQVPPETFTPLPEETVALFLRAVNIGYIAFLVVAALVAWRAYVTTEYALTDSRIYARHGRLRTLVHFTTHDRITDIRYRQGPIDRLLGISRVTFATAGGDVEIIGVRDAIAIKEAAESTRDTFLQNLLERAGVEQQTRAARPVIVDAPETEGAPVPPPPPVWTGPRPDYIKTGDEPLWFGKPRLIASLSAAVPFAGIFVLLLITGGGGPLAFAPAILAVVAFGAIGLRALQLSKMEYTVTDRRVYTRSGVVGTTVTQLTYDKITDITYRQDLLGRLLGFGGVIVNTAGSNQAPASMVGLQRALEVKATIEAARSRYLNEENA